MMPSSWKRQQQTHILSKSRRFAPGTARHSVRHSRKPNKQLTIITLGIVAGIGLPTLAYASHMQSLANSSPEVIRPVQTQQSETSSSTEEVFSSSNVDMKVESTSDSTDEIVGQATINGEIVPLVNGSSTTRHIEGDSNSVDVEISVNNGDSSASISSSSSTEVHVESHSSSDVGTNHTRGSPRR